MTKLEIANFDHIVRETSDIGKHAHARGGGAINVSSETQRIIDQVEAGACLAALDLTLFGSRWLRRRKWRQNLVRS
jgi:hypothetical protein